METNKPPKETDWNLKGNSGSKAKADSDIPTRVSAFPQGNVDENPNTENPNGAKSANPPHGRTIDEATDPSKLSDTA